MSQHEEDLASHTPTGRRANSGNGAGDDGAPWDERRQLVVVAPPRERRDIFETALRVLTAIALLTLIGLLGTLLVLAVDLTRTSDGLSGRIGAAGDAAAQAASSAQRLAQEAGDLLDPTHPPRGALFQDTELDELRLVAAGTEIGKTGEYSLTVASIVKRPGAANPAEAQYAVVYRQLVTPRETRILGQVVLVDRGEADYYLYKGETFRLGSSYYKVNWLSAEIQQVAIVRYRSGDDVTGGVKFDLD